MDNHLLCRVSIITVCHNQLEGLKRTYQSIKNQWANDIEWLVIDGESTDGTKEWLAACDYEKLRYRSESFTNYYEAMNKAVTISYGDWVLFLNAGDLFCDNEALRKTIRLLADSYDVVAGNTVWLSRFGTRVCHARPLDKVDEVRPFYLQSSLWKRTVLLRHPFDTQYSLAADEELLQWAAKQPLVDVVSDFSIGLYDARADLTWGEAIERQRQIRQIQGRYHGFYHQLCWKVSLMGMVCQMVVQALMPQGLLNRRLSRYYTTNC